MTDPIPIKNISWKLFISTVHVKNYIQSELQIYGKNFKKNRVKKIQEL